MSLGVGTCIVSSYVMCCRFWNTVSSADNMKYSSGRHVDHILIDEASDVAEILGCCEFYDCFIRFQREYMYMIIGILLASSTEI